MTVIRCVGIDPGASTGLACLDVPMGRRRPDLEHARWVGHAVVRPSRSTKRSPAEQRAELGTRVGAQLLAWGPAMVVLEEPIDASAGWENATRAVGKATHQARHTLFALGAHFGLALAAAARVSVGPIASYPVNNYHGRPGWMQAGGRRPQRRDDVLRALRYRARSFGCVDELSEDVLMALGVLCYHLTHHSEASDAA